MRWLVAAGLNLHQDDRVAEKCLVCMRKLTSDQFHTDGSCLDQAICWMHFGYTESPVWVSISTLLAPVCYLCGDNPSEHVEHVHPRAKGGEDIWRNIGAACAHCNLSKSDKIGISEAANERWQIQQAAFRSSAERSQAKGFALYDDCIFREEEFKYGAYKEELVEFLADFVNYHLGLEERVDDCESFATLIATEWLQTENGQKFDLLDDLPPLPPLTPAEQAEANAQLIESFKKMKAGLE
jgi:hypothetical protein